MSTHDAMSFATQLDFLPLPQVLQQLAANRVSAKVTVTRREGEGMILLRNGKIIYAATNSAREAVGNLLLTQGLITASALQEALEIQGRSKSDRRLGAILIELGAVDPADVESVVRAQVERVLHELFQWGHGFVKVRPMTIEDGGEVEVDAGDLVVPEGMPVDKVILDALAQGIDRLKTPPFAVFDGDAAGGVKALEPAALDAAGGDRPISLREVLHEIRTTTFTGEVSLHILRFAARFFARGVLFAHGPGELYGMGHFGLPSATSERRKSARCAFPTRIPRCYWKRSSSGPRTGDASKRDTGTSSSCGRWAGRSPRRSPRCP